MLAGAPGRRSTVMPQAVERTLETATFAAFMCAALVTPSCLWSSSGKGRSKPDLRIIAFSQSPYQGKNTIRVSHIDAGKQRFFLGRMGSDRNKPDLAWNDKEIDERHAAIHIATDSGEAFLTLKDG